MKHLSKALFALVAGALFFTSCTKDEEQFDFNKQFELEKTIIKDYVTENYPDMEYSGDSLGMWFEVVEEGLENSYTYTRKDTIINGLTQKVITNPTVKVRYTGKLIPAGTTFQSVTSEEGVSGKLSTFINAWQIAFLPKNIQDYAVGGLTKRGLQKGAKIRIATPSYFAYGNNSSGPISANTPLFFEIEVIDVK